MSARIINSLTNNRIKRLRKMKQKKTRDQFGQFTIESLVTIFDSMKAGVVPDSLLISEEILENPDSKLQYIVNEYPEYYIITEQMNKSYSTLSTVSGITAVYNKPEIPAELDKKVLYLNQINDPGNLGTILRTALAFGWENIVLDETCADIYNPKAINASKGAIFNLNFTIDDNLSVLKKIKETIPVYATALGEGKELSQLTKEKKLCVVMGNEANGVSREILDLADGLINIKMSKKIESLNVAVASGIILRTLSDY